MPESLTAGNSKRFGFSIDNLKGNWYVPFCACAFLLLTIRYTVIEFISAAVAVIIITAAVSFTEPLWPAIRNRSWLWKCFCFLSSAGVLAGDTNHIYELIWRYILRGDLEGILLLILVLLSIVAAVAFLYVCISVFWNKLIGIFRANDTFSDVNITEWIIYASLILLTFAYVTVILLSSSSFYSSKSLVDVVYTGDSQRLFYGNVFLNIGHPENDLRQPLFAVFSAPFVSIAYLIGKLLSVPPAVQAIMLEFTQVILLFVSVFMLTKIMQLDRANRICFILLFMSTHTYLLFSVMIEQYVVAFFWLVLCLYCLSSGKDGSFALMGAGGTLLTSLALLPASALRPGKEIIKERVVKVICCALEFVLLIIAFGKLTIFINMFKDVDVLIGFTGSKLTLFDKIRQFLEYIKNYFVAPDAGVSTVNVEGKQYISWQQDPVESISYIGIIILLLALISLVINRNKVSSRIAGCWILLSMIVLIAIGWGTRENGLILYELYFGWPYLVLIYQLFEKICDRFSLKKIFPVICVSAMVLLAVVNIPEIIDLIDYMSSYYPA